MIGPVRVVMRMIVALPVSVSVRGAVVLLTDRELRGGDTGAHDFRRGNGRSIHRQAAQRRPQFFQRKPGIQEGAQDHVARCTRETIKVKHA